LSYYPNWAKKNPHKLAVKNHHEPVVKKKFGKKKTHTIKLAHHVKKKGLKKRKKKKEKEKQTGS
jgi:hypothetical protein